MKTDCFFLCFLAAFATTGCGRPEPRLTDVRLSSDKRYPFCAEGGLKHWVLENRLLDSIIVTQTEPGIPDHCYEIDWNGRHDSVPFSGNDMRLPPVIVPPGGDWSFSTPVPGTRCSEWAFDPPFRYRLVIPFSVLRNGREDVTSVTSDVEQIDITSSAVCEPLESDLFPGLRPDVDVGLFSVSEPEGSDSRLAVGLANRQPFPVFLETNGSALDVQAFHSVGKQWESVFPLPVDVAVHSEIPANGTLLVPAEIPKKFFSGDFRLAVRFRQTWPRRRRVAAFIDLSSARVATQFDIVPDDGPDELEKW